MLLLTRSLRKKEDVLKKKFKKYIKSTLCKQAYYKLDDYIQDKNAWKHAGPAP